MIFTTPLGLLALLAIPAIVAIHLFRRRFPVRPVAGLFLWQTARQTPGRRRTIARLPITTSLLLECLAALALALILAGARLSSAGVSPHLVVLLDDSVVDGGGQRARRERARPGGAARARRARSSWSRTRASRSSAAASARRCSPVRPRSPSKRGRALEAWKPDAPHHSLRSAFSWRASWPGRPAG